MRTAAFGFGLFACLIALSIPAGVEAGEPDAGGDKDRPPWQLDVRVDFGQDVGQNFGTLFEAVDRDKRVVAGAGFLGAYNTESRSDRRTLHFYWKPVRAEAGFASVERLPRPNDDAGAYLFSFDNRLYAKTRGGRDDRELKVWDISAERWRKDDETVPLSIHVGDGVFEVMPREVRWKGRPVLAVPNEHLRIGENYYADGYFLCRVRDLRDGDSVFNSVVACPWIPADDSQMSLEQGISLEMRSKNEFVYSFGQLADPDDGATDILAATNTGGVYRFDTRKKRWHVHIEPDSATSFQIYSIINYYDRLLMGHYPTGELYEFRDDELRLLDDWPPVMPGVATSAREAQTTAIYGGDLYVGVWPWAEVWRRDRDTSTWNFVRRMFSHPDSTDAVQHPYEEQTAKLGEVLNRWGQRVTSMVPFGDSLYISTSAKNSSPYEPRFEFLDKGKWKDYGAVYRCRLPGNLAVHTEWTSEPTTFRFEWTGTEMRVLQDGKLLGSTAPEPHVTAGMEIDDVRFGNGVYGKLRGDIEHTDFVNR